MLVLVLVQASNFRMREYCCEMHQLQSRIPLCSKMSVGMHLIIIWLLHNLVEASFDLFRYLLLGDQLKP